MIGGDICLCCDSILCGDTWLPSNGIIDIIKEFTKFTTLKARIIERTICNRIQENLFLKIGSIETLPLDHYKISDFL